VGLTRAREHLYLSYAALHRRIHGYGVGEPSRFLREMPEHQLVSLNTRREAPPVRRGRGGYAAAADTVGEDLPFRVGPRAAHARFGEGLVVGIERDGADYVVTVGFASVGRKRLSVQYAHLEEI
jgi:DNA helicase-2/ATP-dependent DNA helicase PcrA